MKRVLSPMTWIGVLISWAIPAASLPTASSFWAWRSSTSISRLSEMSEKLTTAPLIRSSVNTDLAE
jgi:hypothetical protein